MEATKCTSSLDRQIWWLKRSEPAVGTVSIWVGLPIPTSRWRWWCVARSWNCFSCKNSGEFGVSRRWVYRSSWFSVAHAVHGRPSFWQMNCWQQVDRGNFRAKGICSSNGRLPYIWQWVPWCTEIESAKLKATWQSDPECTPNKGINVNAACSMLRFTHEPISAFSNFNRNL